MALAAAWGMTSARPDPFTSLCWLLSQLDNQPQARDPGPQSEFSLPGSTKHLRSQLAQCRQRYQDLQEKLLISEATVFAQANQLEKYRLMFSKSEVSHHPSVCLAPERLHALQTSLCSPSLNTSVILTVVPESWMWIFNFSLHRAEKNKDRKHICSESTGRKWSDI